MDQQQLCAQQSNISDGVSIAEVTRADGKVAPAIWVESKGQVGILVEALEFAFNQVDLQRPYQGIKHSISSISNLLRHFLDEGQPELDERGFRRFINGYFIMRSEGDLDRGLLPLNRQALEAELRGITSFSDFCELRYGYLPLTGARTVSLPSPSQAEKSFWRLMQSNETDFFSHLALRREKRHNTVSLPGRRQKSGGADAFAGMTSEFMWEVIDAEKNPTYRALWLLGTFGGPRLSESMNLWACDVLPGTARQLMFPGDIFVGLPLVVVADPWNSRWCGTFGDSRETRKEFLMSRYGLPPRPHMAENGGGEFRSRAAGYKGTRPTNRAAGIRQLFWADESAAHHFEQTIIEVITNRNRIPKARKHPFMFVNIDPRKPSVQGEMLTLSNVRKSFERAIIRVGGEPYRQKKNPHGMRHLYKDLVKAICGNDSGAVQVCLGHYSRDSQDDYGSLDMQAMRHAMAGTRARGWNSGH